MIHLSQERQAYESRIGSVANPLRYRMGTVLLAVITLAVLSLAGCSSPNPPSTGFPGYKLPSVAGGPGYHAGQVFTLTQPVLIWIKPQNIMNQSPVKGRASGGIGKNGLIPPDAWSRYYLDYIGDPLGPIGSPLSLQSYYQNPAGYSHRIRGVLPGGTRIKFLFDGAPSNAPGVMGYPFFQILNGQFKGFVVDGSLISILGQAGVFVPQPNPQVMRLAKQVSSAGGPS